MSKKILHPKQIAAATFQITCGDKTGTAFFIEGNADTNLVLTSDHNLTEQGQDIKLHLGKVEIEAEILKRIPENDVALLKLKTSSGEEIDALSLSGSQIPYDEEWETYGFPVQRVNSGGRYSGKISRSNQGTVWDVDLDCDQYNKINDFSGLSGAPLVVDGYVVGVIGYDLTGTLAASSITNVAKALSAFGVGIQFEEQASIPGSIEKDISSVAPNDEVLQRINDVVKENIRLGYFLVSGNPGSGKTTIAAQLVFENSSHVVCDRFFVKVPEVEAIPTQIRATPEFFMKWIESVYFRILFDTVPPKSEKPLNDRIALIHAGIVQLSNHYSAQGKIGFLIIDGLDDVTPSKMEDFLAVLPVALPSNLKVIFSCTTKEILPNTYQAAVDSEGEIKVTPLSDQITEQYLSERLKDKNLSRPQITALGKKTEGHPLYLRYLTKYILEIGEIPSVDDWIDSIPVISGEIENYYEKIWIQLDDKTDETWLAATLSRLRMAVDEKTLSEMVPNQTSHSFLSSFNKIKHLLRDDEKVIIYHTSFSSFIVEKTIMLSDSVNKNISTYIKGHPTTTFSISEKIYHLANGDEGSKKSAIDECNQSWIDLCALNSINPDIVLADVKNVIKLAGDLGVAHKVIALLLLSQRINFRYNTLFQENAIFLVNALLALNKPDEALRYVVRNGTLTTGDRDSIYLLQRFFEYDAIEQGEKLLHTINQTCANLVDKGLDQKTFNRYIELKFNAVTLSANLDPKKAFDEFTNIKNAAVRLIEANGNSKETIHKFRDEVGSYNGGYYIWRFDMPPYTKVAEKNKFKFSEKSSGFIALSIYQALEFQEKSPKIKTEDNIQDWITDLEYVIDKFGAHKDYHFTLLYVLVGRSKRYDLIENLYKEVYQSDLAFELRDENGVDLNHQAIHRFTLFAECQGFLDTANQFPELPRYGYHVNWEKNVAAHYKYLCFLEGKIKRNKLEGVHREFSEMGINMSDAFQRIIPELRDRTNWRKGYGLPELFFPMMYRKVTQLLIDASPSDIQILVDTITNKSRYQLGLYTEGYTDSLLVISRQLAKTPGHEVPAFKIAKVLEDHIVSTLENRWERNECLLRVVELYGLLKSNDKAARVFQEMIDTSMGPSWYKEAQLGIINTAISNVLPKKGSTFLQKFAAHLHSASGEMTFQRYVKQQQEDFVGNLAKVGFANKAIRYFKYLLFPDYKTVINNAESGVVDMPYRGEGYVLGARAVEEQAAMLDLLRNLDLKGSFIAWGICELFILGDDRYISGYANLQAGILNELEKAGEENKLHLLFTRLSRFVVSELSDEFRYDYLKYLFDDLSDTNFQRVTGYLEAVGMSSDAPKKESKKAKSKEDEKDDPLEKLVAAKEEAIKLLTLENKTGARKVIVEALSTIQNQKYGVWSSNYSSKINDVRNLLSDSYENSAEFVKDISGLIVNEPYFEEWIIADQLIRLLKSVDEDAEKQLVIEAVLEHIELMVRTPEGVYSKYDWLNEEIEKVDSTSVDGELLPLLIWFLNHPSFVTKNRTIEILTWLGATDTERIISALVQEACSDGYKISKELCASIIHQLSALNPPGFENALIKELTFDKAWLNSQGHFMIRDSILRALKEIKPSGNEKVEGLINEIEQTFAAANNSKGEVIFEESFLTPLDGFINELNDLGVLTRESAILLLKRVNTLAPLPIDDSLRANFYIDRSFNNFNDIALISDFDTLLRSALNAALFPTITLSDSEKVSDVLRFYQPTFPENTIRTVFDPRRQEFEKSIEELFKQGNKIDIDKLLLHKEIPLNYYTTTYSHAQDTSIERNIELTAYLSKDLSVKSEFNRSTFIANRLVDTQHNEDGDTFPMFRYCHDAHIVTGSEIVPARFTKKVPPKISEAAKTIYWRTGRNWNQSRQGVAQKTGFYTTIDPEILSQLKGEYKVIWQIELGYEMKYIDVFEGKEIEE